MIKDLYAETTARIVAALERGVAPWVRPWSSGADTLPMNAGSLRPYRGVNVLLLALEAEAHGYPRNRWLTYRQAAELGGRVRRGEEGTTVVFWRLRKTSTAEPAVGPSNVPERVVPLLRAYTVFNVAQVDDLPGDLTEVVAPAWIPETEAEALLAASEATIRHGGAKAFYSPGTDDVHLPPRHLFASADRYYNVALHARLNQINVSEHLEKKGSFNYLSWSYAVAQLRLADPSAIWEVLRHEGLPYLKTEAGYFVEVAVTVQGVTLSQIHPVLDGKNRPLSEPTAFDINTSLQRCLVKAIALHGLGLYVYSGEDLPNGEEPSQQPKVSPVQRERTITVGQQRFLERLLVEAGWTEARLLDYFGIQTTAELPMAEFDRALKALQQAKRRAA